MKRLTLSVSILAAAVVAAVCASAAEAAPPQRLQFSDSGTIPITGLCPFEITADFTQQLSVERFFDQNGVVLRAHVHIVEQDTFSANGKSLTGVPFTYNVELLVDSSGNPTQFYVTGVVEKVPLPDRSQFHAAGRIDFAAHGFPDFLFTPDHGATVNLDGFCAALAP